MDLGTAIIGGVLLLVCIIPIVIAHNSSNKKYKKTLAALSDYAAEKSCKINQQDIWIHAAIGIDTQNRILFFLKGDSNAHTIEHIDLNKIEESRVITPDSREKSDRINRLVLELQPVNNSEQPAVLEFYNANVSMQLADELILAKKWKQIINDVVGA